MRKMKIELMFGLLLLIWGLQGKAHDQVQTFNDEKTLLPASHNIAWMNNLDDHLLISEITLPGTHDTMALYGGPAAECQAWTLEDQLKAGIRYLDLRVFAFNKKLYLMHGIIYQHSTFEEVLKTIMKFLSNNPRETVLVRVKQVFCVKCKVQKLVQMVINNYANIWEQPKMPTLAEARGKVVLVQKNNFELGIRLVETDSKGDYKVVDIEEKKEVIKANLKKCNGQSACLIYSSGTGFGTLKGMLLTPKKVAQNINPWLYDHLQVCSSNRAHFGIIAMDFPGSDLIQRVINCNTV